MTISILLFWAFSGHYFADATIYDERSHGLREGVHVLVGATGKVVMVTRAAIPVDAGVTVIRDALLLPHYSDFYCLVQERGLGLDQDFDLSNQAQMARYLRRIGVHKLRDPVFPSKALSELMTTMLDVYASRGYLELVGGAGEAMSQVIEPDENLDQVVPSLPRGPVTLWWTTFGSDKKVIWPDHPAFLTRLIKTLHGQGRLVGAYIQDAACLELSALYDQAFDFYEGLPGCTPDLSRFPANLTWIPLASLNDKRYCAVNLEERLAALVGLGLYNSDTLQRAQAGAASVRNRIADRCQIWRERRNDALGPVRAWLARGGKLALGSAGGHLFTFSGDLRSELRILDELGAEPRQLLRAAFETTPSLLGGSAPFLITGQLANFIVYSDNGYWLSRVGKPVAMNFQEGRNVLAAGELLPLK